MFEFLTDIHLSFGPIIGIVFILISILFLGWFVSGKPSSAEIESISKNPALNKAVSSLKGSEKKVKEVEKESEQEESEAAEGAKEEKVVLKVLKLFWRRLQRNVRELKLRLH